MGGYRDRRGADHRPRRRLLPRGRQRQALSRRARRPVLRQRRLLVRRGDRPGGARADARSCPSTRTGRTPTRARSSWPSEVASLAPGDLNRVFFVLGRLRGGRVGLEARAAVLRRTRPEQGHGGARGARDDARRDRRRAEGAAAPLQGDRAPHRVPRHDARRAVDQRHPGHPHAVRAPRARGAARRATRTATTGRPRRPRRSSRRSCSRTSRRRSSRMGPETVCLVHMEPVQNAGGCFTPPAGYWQGVRELCTKYDILLSADEVITGLRSPRLLVRLGALRHPARHHHLREGSLVLLCGDRRRRSPPTA